MSKHTKGPWFMEFPDKFEDCIITAESRSGMIEICSMDSVYPDMTPSCKFEAEQLTNAKLIVAAPELLEACEAMVADGWLLCGEEGLSEAQNKVLMAIAKAKGEA